MKKKLRLFLLFASLSILASSFFTSCDQLTSLMDTAVVTITYDTTIGTKPATLKKQSGYQLTADDLKAPAGASGHTFDGWYLDDDDNKTIISPGYEVKKDIVLVAKWDGSSGHQDDGDDDGEDVTLNVYSYTDEVPGMVEKYLATHKDVKAKLNVTIIPTTNDEYQPALDKALKDGNVDIYVAEDACVLKYTQGSMSSYAAPYKNFGIDIDKKIETAETASYVVDFGTNKNGKVVGLGYQSTGGCFIYNRSQAKAVFGTDDPETIQEKIGGGSGKWDKFWEAAAECAKNNVAIISGDGDIWHPIEASSDFGWVKDNKLYIDPKRGDFFEISKNLTDNGWSNGTEDWTEDWYADMSESGDKKVLGFFGPAWLINYCMAEKSGSTYGDWAVCKSPINFFWGGTWLLGTNNAANNSKKKAIVKDILEWITLDTTETGLMYQWANGTFQWKYGVGKDTTLTTKDTVSSAAVMKKSNGEVAFLNGQNMFDYFVPAGESVNSRVRTEYDSVINKIWREAVRNYASGETNNPAQAVKMFKEEVYRQTGLTYDAEVIQEGGGIVFELNVPKVDDCISIRRRIVTDDTDLNENVNNWFWASDTVEICRIYNRVFAKKWTVKDVYGIEKGKKYQYAYQIDWKNISEPFVKTAEENGISSPIFKTKPVGKFDGEKIIFETVPEIKYLNGESYIYQFLCSYVKTENGNTDWDKAFYPSYTSDTPTVKEQWGNEKLRNLNLELQNFTLFLSNEGWKDGSPEFAYIFIYDKDTFDFPTSINSARDPKVDEPEFVDNGIKLQIEVPANTDCVSLKRRVVTKDTNTDESIGNWIWGSDAVEVCTITDKVPNVSTKEILDRYGIEKGVTYQYGMVVNYSVVSKTSFIVTAENDGFELPEFEVEPECKFIENSKVAFTTKPKLTFKNNEEYSYTMTLSYIRLDSYNKNAQDWNFGFYPEWNSDDTSANAGVNLVYDSCSGLELSLVDVQLKLKAEKGITYMFHYSPDAFSVPEKIYRPNAAKEITTKEGLSGIEFSVPVPAKTQNVAIFRYDDSVKDYVEIISKYYGGENAPEEGYAITLTDFADYKAGKVKYYVKYDWWKRYDGYADSNPTDERGFTFTATKDGYKSPLINSGPAATFDGAKFNYTDDADLTWYTEKFGYWIQTVYVPVAEGVDSKIYLTFDSSAWDENETKYFEPKDSLNYPKGTKFKLESASFNIFNDNDGQGYNIIKSIPLEKLSRMPQTITIQ